MGLPFNLVIVTDLITVMVRKKEVDLLAKDYCSVDSFQIYELVYV